MLKLSVCIDVSDLELATDFYCGALGCSLLKTQPSHNTLSAAGTTLHLSNKQAGSPATPTGATRTYKRHWTPVHLDFDVDDVDAVAEKVKQLGGSVESIKRGDWGAAAFCADPFGHGFCLIELESSVAG
jgi:predicted enzyme related to lactoylglutathione lyase